MSRCLILRSTWIKSGICSMVSELTLLSVCWFDDFFSAVFTGSVIVNQWLRCNLSSMPWTVVVLLSIVCMSLSTAINYRVSKVTSQALQNSREWTPNEGCLQAATENWQRWCSVTWDGQTFQIWAVVIGKARLPTVDNCVWQTGSDDINSDHRRDLIQRPASWSFGLDLAVFYVPANTV